MEGGNITENYNTKTVIRKMVRINVGYFDKWYLSLRIKLKISDSYVFFE